VSNIFSENPEWAIGSCIAIFIAFATHRFAMHRINMEHFRKKANAFESAIKREFAEIYPIQAQWPENVDDYFRSIFPTLQAAVSEFREALPKSKASAFDEAWFIYRLGRDGREIDQQCYFQYMGFQNSEKPYIEPRKAFKENVDSLLSFTKET